MGRGKESTDNLKENMADALLALMKEKPIEKVTIQEITERAKVGRVTYFRNFNSKTEMLTFKLVKLWDRWSEENNLGHTELYSLDNSYDFFAFNYHYRDIIDLIYVQGAELAIFDAASEIFHRRKPQDDSYIFLFLAHGLYGCLGEWVKNRYRETPMEMAQFVAEIGNLAATDNLKAKKILPESK
ncbi:MAG: TetR/AcrR family transcriptional regulator [Anaerotardibacter sp.]